jgi:Paf1
MDVGILEPKEVPEFGTDYVFAAFLPSESIVPEIKSHLQSGTDVPSPVYNYSHIRDYEGNLLNPPVTHDYAVYFLNERRGTQRRGAYYLPISGKSNLKRRRTTRTQYAQPDKLDGIELTLRGATAEETVVFEKAKRDFEEGGPKEESVQDDDLSDADAEGEDDPLYTRN